MKTLFAVFQEGVYRHACGGIYDSLDLAITAADDIAAADRDSYHNYDVVPFTLNTPPDNEPVLYTVRKGAAGVRTETENGSEAER